MEPLDPNCTRLRLLKVHEELAPSTSGGQPSCETNDAVDHALPLDASEPVGLRELIPLQEVPRLLPFRTHRSTVFRWVQKGRRGVRLRVVSVGSTMCTTERWLMSYFEAVGRANGMTSPAASDGDTCQVNQRAIARRSRSARVLRRHGLDVPRP